MRSSRGVANAADGNVRRIVVARCLPSPLMSAEALAKADVGEGGAKRRMRGFLRE